MAYLGLPAFDILYQQLFAYAVHKNVTIMGLVLIL